MCGDHRDLHVLTHSFPTRRSSDLVQLVECCLKVALAHITLRKSEIGLHRVLDIDIGAGIAAASAKRHAQSDNHECARLMPLHRRRSEENTSELQSLMRISYAVFCLKKKKR